MSDEGDKNFAPTEQRREQFRKDGRFARSRDAAAVASTISVVGVLLGSRTALSDSLSVLFRSSIGDLSALSRGQPGDVFRLAGQFLATAVGPVLVAASTASFVVGIVQSGLRINLDAIGFKPERLNPISRLQQIFSPKKAAVEVLLSLLRVGVVGYVAYRIAMSELPEMLTLSRASVEVSATRMVAGTSRIVIGAVGALAGIAIVDYAQSRFSIGQQMMMTRQEMKDEMRQNEGDPKLKGRMKARARALAKRRMLQSVKKADVVVTNPTHVAVALRYGDRDPAPVVLAKGHDDAALRIRTEARKYGIPILENRPLARALDAEVAIGQPIPVAHFAAVARVLAFVYRIRGGKRRVGTRRA
ncbi:MAG: EscU/YscU/HrcU family type III secretion system export apparatus switch protein [Polyangiaceae bacterium]|jgi:flagellar biosynthetic protein FlhB